MIRGGGSRHRQSSFTLLVTALVFEGESKSSWTCSCPCPCPRPRMTGASILAGCCRSARFQRAHPRRRSGLAASRTELCRVWGRVEDVHKDKEVEGKILGLGFWALSVTTNRPVHVLLC